LRGRSRKAVKRFEDEKWVHRTEGECGSRSVVRVEIISGLGECFSSDKPNGSGIAIKAAEKVAAFWPEGPFIGLGYFDIKGNAGVGVERWGVGKTRLVFDLR
jgi:hypothetical protein